MRLKRYEVRYLVWVPYLAVAWPNLLYVDLLIQFYYRRYIRGATGYTQSFLAVLLYIPEVLLLLNLLLFKYGCDYILLVDLRTCATPRCRVGTGTCYRYCLRYLVCTVHLSTTKYFFLDFNHSNWKCYQSKELVLSFSTRVGSASGDKNPKSCGQSRLSWSD